VTAVLAPAGVEPGEVVAGLRAWAAGFTADEAAVELLIAISHELPAVLDPFPGFYAAWIDRCPRPGLWFLDGGNLADAADGFPLRLRPVILTAAALATDGALLDLGVTLAGISREWLGPVFAALAHAAGCRGLRLVATDGCEPGLFPWLEPGSALPPGPSRAALTLGGAA
jgi:hypothetical protein